MSPRRTRRGTIRESISEVDSSMRSAPKSAKKTRQTRKSQNTKNSEEDSDGPVEQSNNSIASSQVTRSTRKRKQENKDQTLNESIDTRSTRSVSKATKSKRKTRVAKQQVSEASSIFSEDEGFNAKNESKSINKSVAKKSSAPNNKDSGNITPESSSPVVAPPIPHRSTKTPKKSPSNLGSPKTHSKTTLRSFKVPRKLSVDSLPSSEQSNNDSLLQQTSFSGADKSIDKSNNSSTLKVLSTGKKTNSPLKTKSGLSKSLKSKVKSPKPKTPVLVKKSPSSRTSLVMEKSLKVNLSNSLGLKTSLLNDSSFKLEKTHQSALQESTKASPKKDTLKNKSRDSSKQSPVKTSRASLVGAKKSPKVVLSQMERKITPKPHRSYSSSLGQSKLLSTSLKSKKSPKFVSSFTPGKTPKIALSIKSSITQKQKKISPLKEKSPEKKPIKQSIDQINVPLDASMSPKVMLNKLSTSECNSKSPKSKRPSLITKIRTSVPKPFGTASRKSSKPIVYTPVAFGKRLSQMKPLTSSTPREKVKPKKSVISSTVKSKITKKLSNRTNSKVGDKLLDDESEPSMDESSLVHLSDVYGTDDSGNEISFGGNNSNAVINSEAKRRSKGSPKNSKNGTIVNKSSSISLSKDETNKNNTYEVENPKTPKFQNKIDKKKAVEADKSIVQGRVMKRSCKVQFASPVPKTRGSSLGISRVGTPGHAIRKNKTSLLAHRTSLIKQSPANKEDGKNRTSQVIIRRLKNIENTSSNKTPGNTPLNKNPGNTPLNKNPANTPLNKKLVDSASGNSTLKSNKKSLPASAHLSKSKPFVRLEKKTVTETKTPARKIPNFGDIHKKTFAKMESLVDMKKRVEERHMTLNAPTSSTKKVPLSRRLSKADVVDPSNGTHNRFGWPVRKSGAIDIINKKAKGNVESSDKRREKTRTTVKGVRMNRRFELQMKSRMKNS
ncbi:serine/arginine repetitive matrix protein 1 [Copidosoma floridanum]|uniref:serine/arginine repetitive matrix protein 1 n=1 Tax=Copidosoma floridanum TaxID=29053 RepID=UPI0006C95B5C|nr:serine/arginine repetitive matrix protein 1 [Copidosoma floridanum]XP_014205818.1 serine/arginine repetitive matrix protein 1 [Copidosoma floridanum]